jgi:hypothetical protein
LICHDLLDCNCTSLSTRCLSWQHFLIVIRILHAPCSVFAAGGSIGATTTKRCSHSFPSYISIRNAGEHELWFLRDLDYFFNLQQTYNRLYIIDNSRQIPYGILLWVPSSLMHLSASWTPVLSRSIIQRVIVNGRTTTDQLLGTARKTVLCCL